MILLAAAVLAGPLLGIILGDAIVLTHVHRMLNDPRVDTMTDDEVAGFVDEQRAEFKARLPRWLR